MTVLIAVLLVLIGLLIVVGFADGGGEEMTARLEPEEER